MRAFKAIFIVFITIIGLVLAPLPSFPNEKATSRQEDEMNQSKQLNEQALHLFKQGKLQEAISIWERASKLAIDQKVRLTSNAEVLNNLGFAYFKLGRDHYPEAIEYLKSALVIDANRWTIYLNLGDIYMAMVQQALAVDNYKKVLELKPDYKYADRLQSVITTYNMRDVKKKLPKKVAQADTANPKESLSKDARQLTRQEYSFSVGPGLLAYRFILYLDQEGDPKHIDVFPSNNEKAVQTLDVNDNEYGCRCDTRFTVNNRNNLQMVDMNFDGYQDLRLLCHEAMHNTSYHFWLFDSATGKFNYNSVISDLDNIRIASKTKTVTSDTYLGCAGECHVFEKYMFIGNEFALIDSEEYYADDDGNIKKRTPVEELKQ